MRSRFHEHVLHMGSYGALTQPKPVSDLLVPKALAHEIKDLAFSLGELIVHGCTCVCAALTGPLYNFVPPHVGPGL